MSNQSFLKYFVVIAIWFSLPQIVIAETKVDETQDSQSQNININSRLSSPWENATLAQTLESSVEINSIKFSPDGQLLASVGEGQITLWQVESGQIQRVLPGHYSTELGLEIAPTAISFSPDSQFLATATWSQGLLSADSSIMVWNTTTGAEVLSLEAQDGCRQILFDIDGKIIYGACGLGVTAWSFPKGEKLLSFATKHPLEAIALSPDGEIMATVDAKVTEGKTAEQSNKILLWQLAPESTTFFNTLAGHANDIAQLEFTPDGKRLVSSSYDGKINVWDWQQGKTYRNTNNLYSDNGLFSLSANSRLIAGDFHDSAMSNLITGLPLRNVIAKLHQGELNTIAFSPQEQLLAQVEKSQKSTGSVINLWRTDTSQPAKSAQKRKDYVPISITEHWGKQEQFGTEETIELKTDHPSSIGKDPQAIALAALGLTETAESEQEQVELDYPQDNLAIVTITQTNLADDSVAAKRYLVEFAPYGDQADQQWQVIWAGQKFKCQANRGHQDWGTDLCQ